jgi:maltooligosyltrehalose trehalohydrolase
LNAFYQPAGAFYRGNGRCDFSVWAPLKEKVELLIVQPQTRRYPMQKNEQGYWTLSVDDTPPGTEYFFVLDGNEQRPDPASLSQPSGVHGPSAIADRTFDWHDDNWTGLQRQDLIIYELHTGTFSPERNFEGIIRRLDYLQALGITAIELMPVAQFPGSRNWGYDGVYPFAVQHSYGGVQGLKQLVDAAHRAGIAVILDVVYNHMGPEGNYLGDFAPYFTDKYKTPWGKALNFDDAWCDGVRSYFIQNALMWLDEFHIDGLRLDAVHAIWDFGAHHFIQELREEVAALEKRTGRTKIIIAEFDLNNTRYVSPVDKGGYGLDAQWIDEFHHALHSVLTGETNGYYEDFGKLFHIEKAFRDTYVYNGIYSTHRKKTFGSAVVENDYDQFVAFAQNHDQIGNRLLGDRLSASLSFEALKLAAATVLLSPYIPLLFMGEEYGEKNPFLFFCSYESPELVETVRKSRKEEFAYFRFEGNFPDPQDEDSFNQCQLSWNQTQGQAATLLLFYKTLIALRKTHPVLLNRKRNSLKVQAFPNDVLLVERSAGGEQLFLFFNFSKQPQSCQPGLPVAAGKLFDSAAEEWNGPGPLSPSLLQAGDSLQLQPESVVVFEKIN